jgi:hypothetical protein
MRSMMANGRKFRFREAKRSDSQGSSESRKLSKEEGVVVARLGYRAGGFKRRQCGAVRGSKVAGIASGGSVAGVPEGEAE